MANLQPSESRIPDTWFITLTFSLIVTFYLVKHKNRTLCLYLHTKSQVCSIGQTSFRQTVGKEGLGSAPNPTAKQTSKKLALIRVVTHPKNFDSLHSWSIGRPKLIHQLLILQCNTQSRSTLPVAILLGSLILKKENILALYVKLVDVRWWGSGGIIRSYYFWLLHWEVDQILMFKRECFYLFQYNNKSSIWKKSNKFELKCSTSGIRLRRC